MSKNKLGLVVGSFLALLHAVWSLSVAVMPASVQAFFVWVLDLHHIDFPFTIITPFVLIKAIELVILTFVVGYIVGWVLGWLRQVIGKCKCR